MGLEETDFSEARYFWENVIPLFAPVPVAMARTYPDVG